MCKKHFNHLDLNCDARLHKLCFKISVFRIYWAGLKITAALRNATCQVGWPLPPIQNHTQSTHYQYPGLHIPLWAKSKAQEASLHQAHEQRAREQGQGGLSLPCVEDAYIAA